MTTEARYSEAHPSTSDAQAIVHNVGASRVNSSSYCPSSASAAARERSSSNSRSQARRFNDLTIHESSMTTVSPSTQQSHGRPRSTVVRPGRAAANNVATMHAARRHGCDELNIIVFLLVVQDAARHPGVPPSRPVDPGRGVVVTGCDGRDISVAARWTDFASGTLGWMAVAIMLPDVSENSSIAEPPVAL